jgi:hypothetical protein
MNWIIISREWIFIDQEIRTETVKNTIEMGAVSACVVIIKDEGNKKECLNWKHYWWWKGLL